MLELTLQGEAIPSGRFGVERYEADGLGMLRPDEACLSMLLRACQDWGRRRWRNRGLLSCLSWLRCCFFVAESFVLRLGYQKWTAMNRARCCVECTESCMTLPISLSGMLCEM